MSGSPESGPKESTSFLLHIGKRQQPDAVLFLDLLPKPSYLYPSGTFSLLVPLPVIAEDRQRFTRYALGSCHLAPGRTRTLTVNASRASCSSIRLTLLYSLNQWALHLLRGGSNNLRGVCCQHPRLSAKGNSLVLGTPFNLEHSLDVVTLSVTPSFAMFACSTHLSPGTYTGN